MNKKTPFFGMSGRHGILTTGLAQPPTLPPEVLAAFKAATNPKGTNPSTITGMVAGSKKNVINCEGYTPEYIAAVLSLYDDLLLDKEICATRTIDIHLIVTEGFPAFESTIGAQNFKKLKKYYGIGYNADKTAIKKQELQDLLARLRTIDNACRYIHGYWDAILFLDECLDETNPIAGLTDRERKLSNAKLAFLAGEVLCGDWYPLMYFKRCEDEKATPTIQVRSFDIKRRYQIPTLLPDYARCNQKKDTTPYGPEELIRVADKFRQYGKGCIIVDQLMTEVGKLIERGVLDEVMSFCELRFYKEKDGWNFRTHNIPNPYNTVEKVKALKRRANPERYCIAMEVFLLKPMIDQMDQEEVWTLYTILVQSNCVLDGNFPKINGGFFYADNVRESMQVYKLTGKTLLAGPIEAQRCLDLARYVYANDLPLSFAYCDNKVPAGQVLTAITLAQNLGCKLAYATGYTTAANYESSVSYAGSTMKIAREIMAMDKTGVLKREFYAEEKATSERLKEELGITDEDMRRWGAEIPKAEEVVETCGDISVERNAVDPETHPTYAEADQIRDVTAVLDDACEEKDGVKAGVENVDVDSAMSAPVEEPVEADAAVLEVDAVMLAADMDLSDDSQMMEFILKWARLKGYLVKSEVDEQQRQIIQSVLINGNQEKIRSFANGEFTEKAFFEAIGFEEDDDIVKGYFDRDQVAPDELTKHCILINKKFRKKNGKTPAVKCTVRLYNYLVDRRIECGPDYVFMKRDKSLLKFKFPNDK